MKLRARGGRGNNSRLNRGELTSSLKRDSEMKGFIGVSVPRRLEDLCCLTALTLLFIYCFAFCCFVGEDSGCTGIAQMAETTLGNGHRVSCCSTLVAWCLSLFLSVSPSVSVTYTNTNTTTTHTNTYTQTREHIHTRKHKHANTYTCSNACKTFGVTDPSPGSNGMIKSQCHDSTL